MTAISHESMFKGVSQEIRSVTENIQSQKNFADQIAQQARHANQFLDVVSDEINSNV